MVNLALFNLGFLIANVLLFILCVFYRFSALKSSKAVAWYASTKRTQKSFWNYQKTQKPLLLSCWRQNTWLHCVKKQQSGLLSWKKLGKFLSRYNFGCLGGWEVMMLTSNRTSLYASKTKQHSWYVFLDVELVENTNFFLKFKIYL